VKPSPVSLVVWKSRLIVMSLHHTPLCWQLKMSLSSARKSESPHCTSNWELLEELVPRHLDLAPNLHSELLHDLESRSVELVRLLHTSINTSLIYTASRGCYSNSYRQYQTQGWSQRKTFVKRQSNVCFNTYVLYTLTCLSVCDLYAHECICWRRVQFERIWLANCLYCSTELWRGDMQADFYLTDLSSSHQPSLRCLRLETSSNSSNTTTTLASITLYKW